MEDPSVALGRDKPETCYELSVKYDHATYLNKLNYMVSVAQALGISNDCVRADFRDLRKQIDEDLDQATSVFRRCDLLAFRNVLAPISSLPAELLSEVFRLNVEDDNDHNPPVFGGRVEPFLKTATHVCCYWRQVALGNHCLWSASLDFLDEYPAWTLERLRRSGGTPFELHANFRLLRGQLFSTSSDVEKATSNVHLGLYFISQVQSLHLCAKSPAFDHFLKSIKGNAPVLESLSLEYDHDVGKRGPPICQLPKSLLDMGTPVLRHLTLQNCTVEWTASMFQRLTHLDITYPSVGVALPPMSGLCSVLLALPFLQKLCLRNVVSAFDASSRTVALNHLMFLEITGIAYHVTSFIHVLLFPNNVMLRVHGTCSSPDDIATAWDLIGSRMCGLWPSEEVVVVEQNNIMLCGWETCGNIRLSSLSRFYVSKALPSASIHVSMTWDRDLHPIRSSILSQLVSSALHLVAPTEVENLVLELDPAVMPPASVLSATLRPFVGVTRLRLECSLPPSLLSAISKECIMPLLDMLIIAQIDFTPPITSQTEGEYQSLSHFLNRRRLAHGKLRRLQMLDCWNLTDENLKALDRKAAVVTLHGRPSIEELELEYEMEYDEEYEMEYDE